jgi:hypothetical protein
VELFQLAIALGGARAMERALATRGTIDRKLAAAAGVSADSVVRLWVARTRSVPKASESMSLTVAAASIGWILVFGVFAVRSSRWR